jgi:hypothetical protein
LNTSSYAGPLLKATSDHFQYGSLTIYDALS